MTRRLSALDKEIALFSLRVTSMCLLKGSEKREKSKPISEQERAEDFFKPRKEAG